MNWREAKIACKKLGLGWRLPIKEELNMLYENKEEIGGFANNDYWSSSEFDNFNAWVQNFYNGVQTSDIKNGDNYVRAVRSS